MGPEHRSGTPRKNDRFNYAALALSIDNSKQRSWERESRALVERRLLHFAGNIHDGGSLPTVYPEDML